VEPKLRTSYLAPLLRWWWVVLLVVLAAEIAVLYTLITLAPSYKSSVKLQIVAPGPRQVSLFGDQQSQVLRDQIFLVQNNFIEIIKSDAIAQKTVDEVGTFASSQDILDKLTVSPIPNTDFVYIYLTWPDPVEGPQIVSTQVRVAQEYFARSAARPASSSRQFISQQLAGAKQQLDQADTAFAKFKSERRIADMDQEIKSLQDLITTLRLDRERAVAAGQAPAAAALDKSLNDRYRQMSDLISTSFDYSNLQATVRRAQETYDLLKQKESEAILKENESLNVDFIQVLEDARTPAMPVPPRTREIAVLGAFAGLLLGSLLALMLDMRGARARLNEQAFVEGLTERPVDARAAAPSSSTGSPAPAQSQFPG